MIPVINSSNSKEKLADININEKHGISAEIIDDISLFIDDMRLLYNINNEFMIYSGLLDKGLPRDNLFAMLVYKNIYPEDFVALGNNKGILYNLLQKRPEYIKEQTARIDAQLQQNKKRLDELRFTMLKDADELRTLYVAKFVDKTNGFSHFSFAGENYTLWQASSGKGFEFFKKGVFSYFVHANNGNWYALNAANANFKFENFEKEVDENQSYADRLKDIQDVLGESEERLKKEIQSLEKERGEIRHAKLKDIFADKKNVPVTATGTPQGQLLTLLLRSGYIGEDYLDYISLFYEGSLTKADYTFFINVKRQTESDYDLALAKIANLIRKIRPVEFGQGYLLNYNLMDFMLVNEGYDEQLAKVLGQLNDDNDYGIAFMDGFMDVGVNTAVFINRLLHKWPALWNFIEDRSGFTKEKIESYFIDIIANGAVADLLTATTSPNLEKKIAGREDLLTLIPDSGKLESIIKNLEISFTDVLLADAPQSLVNLVIKDTHYILNDRMLRRVMQTNEKFDLPAYETQNYSAVLNSGIPELIKNVENKLDRYTTQIYLPLTGNVQEPETELVKLLNAETIEPENRRQIITRSETILTTLFQINNKDLDEVIFNARKIAVNWNNVVEHFSRHEGIDLPLLNYLNDSAIAAVLSATEIDFKQPNVDSDTVENFMHHLVCEGRLSNDNFELLTKAVPYKYDMGEISSLNREQMEVLVNHRQIAPKPENFDELKLSFFGLQNNFLDVFVNDVSAGIADYKFDGNDIAHMLQSEAYNLPNKLKLIESVDENIITGSTAALTQIRRLMFEHHPLPLTKTIMIGVLNQYAALHERIQLFNMYYQAFDSEDAQTIFKNFPAPFNKIGIRHTSFVIPKEGELEFLANNLQEIGMIVNQKPDKKGIKIINYKWN